MFLGVKAHHDAKRVVNYAQARAALERAMLTPTGKRRAEKTWGYHLGANRNHGVSWVRLCDEPGHEGAIAFRLYDTDVVTWYPDNSVVIENYGTVTTSGFAARFLPTTISLSHPTTRRGSEGGHKGIHYRKGHTRFLCSGYAVRFVQEGEDWVPDESTCLDMRFPELSKSGTRAVAREHNLSDFETWLGCAPHLMDVVHEGWDLDECAEALRERDFARAAAHLPLVHLSASFGIADRVKPIPIKVHRWDHVVSPASLRKLRVALWDEAGLMGTIVVKTIQQADFDKRMARVREMRALGLAAHDMGPTE